MPQATQSDPFLRFLRGIAIAAIALGFFYLFLWLLKGALTPLAIAFVLAYLLDPMIDRFESHGFPRSAAILILLLIGGVLTISVVLVLVPQLQHQISEVSQSLPAYLKRTTDTFLPWLEKTAGLSLPSNIRDLVEEFRTKRIGVPFELMGNLLGRFVEFSTGTIGAILSFLVIPVIAYYFLVEFDHITQRLLALIPIRYRNFVETRAQKIDRLLSNFVRGQLTVSMVLGILYAIGFTAIGVDLGIGIGLVGGLLAIIPYVGGAVALSLASAMCILEFGIDLHLLLVILWYTLVQTLEGFLLTPKIVGGQLGLHPVAVIVALMIGADLLGFLGMLIAVPVAAMLKVFVGEALEQYRASSFYREHAEEQDG